ncbi:hypothetical protein Acr_00g0020910 [Actinidia rufa]|uniref:CCHC-type domain-containing protein n=1 Tax=Actinidia rufa TaxID=165716 RepID=A0A7J0DC39_9ERIC|nr:hypothetical protein Acr_00g0020910 [Actinidia rufa]
MPPRRGRGRRGAAEPEDRVDRIERILEGLVQVVHDVHNNNNHDEAPQQPAMPMPGAGAMPRTTIKQFQQRFEAGLRWNIKNKVEILRLPTHQEVLHAALIAEESLNEMSQFRENRKKRIGGNKKHWGECRMGSRGCYGCGQEGHQIRDCPMRKRIQGAGTSASASVQQPPTERGDNQPRQGRAFALVPGNTPATTSVVSGILPICGQPAHILMDSGSTHSFVSHSFEYYLNYLSSTS